MRLRKLEIKDMFPFGHAKLNLFESDLALIIGDNDEAGKESNGSGKSSLFDSIAYALFGKIVRKVPVEHLVRFGQKQGKIVLSFELDGKVYRIRRYRGANNALEFHVKESDGIKDLTGKTVTQTQGIIEETIGMDFETFRAVAYFGQHDVSVFAQGSSKDRLQIVGRLLRLDALDGAAKVARRLAGDVEKDRVRLQAQRERADASRSEIDADACRIEIQNCDASLDTWTEESQSAGAKYEVLGEWNRLLSERDAFTVRLSDILSEWNDERKKLRDRIGSLRGKAKTLPKIKKEIDELGEVIEPLEALKGEKDSLEVKISQGQQRFSQADGKKKALEAERAEILEALDLEGADCPTCGQKIGKAAITALKEKAAEKDREAVELGKKMKVIRGRLREGAAKILELNESIDKLEIQKGSLTRLRLSQQEAEGAEEQIRQTEIDLDEKKKRYEGKRDGLRAERKKVKSAIKKVDDGQNDLVDRMEGLREKQRGADAEIRILTGRRATMVEKIDASKKLDKEVERYDERLIDLNAKHAIYSYWAEGFPRIKLLIVDSFLPEFERAVNEHLAKLMPQVQVRFETLVPKKGRNAGYMEKFEIFIADIHTGREQPWDSWSGGEKKRVALALYLGLNAVASRAMESKIGFLMLDEVLADLDQTGRDLALELFEEERRGQRSILIVSHIPDIHTRFDNVITVVKRRGVSTVRAG